MKKYIAASNQKPLIKVDQVHPQVLVYTAAVASKSMTSGESQSDKDEHQKKHNKDKKTTRKVKKNERLDVIECAFDEMRENSPSLRSAIYWIKCDLKHIGGS